MARFLRDIRFLAGVAAGAVVAAGVGAALSQAPARSSLTGSTVEERLLAHVIANAREGDAASVLRVIDEFCRASANNWAMNVGDEKGAILAQRVLAARPKLALEFGGYCGYSAVLIGSLLPEDGRLISIELNASFAAIATKVIEFAGLRDRVTVMVSSVERALPQLLTRHGAGSVDFLFIDHWKERYLPDMRLVEGSALLHTGAVIVADNVYFPGAPEYLAYMVDNARYATEVVESHLEYSTRKDALCISTVR